MLMGMGLTCPEGQQPTNTPNGMQCCGVPGTSCEADPCSYCNTPQYIATQTAAAAAALQPGGAGPLGASILESIASYPQNIQSDAIDCVSNPGLTFTDEEGISVTCPQAYTMDNGIPVSIYTAAQLAQMLSAAATPTTETPINVIGTSIPAAAINVTTPNLPAVTSGTVAAPVSTTAAGSTSSSSPSGSSSSSSTSTSGASSTSGTSTLDLSFLTDDSLISGVPNWGVAVAAIVALMLLPKLIGGR